MLKVGQTVPQDQNLQYTNPLKQVYSLAEANLLKQVYKRLN